MKSFVNGEKILFEMYYAVLIAPSVLESKQIDIERLDHISEALKVCFGYNLTIRLVVHINVVLLAFCEE
jgi:uncharacterized sodium:solute symporter family permease YidK